MGRWKPNIHLGGRAKLRRPEWEVAFQQMPVGPELHMVTAVNEAGELVLGSHGSSRTQVVRVLVAEVLDRTPRPGLLLVDNPADAKLLSKYLPTDVSVEVVDELPLLRGLMESTFDSMLPPRVPAIPPEEAGAWREAMRRLEAHEPWNTLGDDTRLLVDGPSLRGRLLVLSHVDGDPALELYDSLEAHERFEPDDVDDDTRILELRLPMRRALDEAERAACEALGLRYGRLRVPHVVVSEGFAFPDSTPEQRGELLSAIDTLCVALRDARSALLARDGREVTVTTSTGATRVTVLAPPPRVPSLDERDAKLAWISIPSGWQPAGETITHVLCAFPRCAYARDALRILATSDQIRVATCGDCGRANLVAWCAGQPVLDLVSHLPQPDSRPLEAAELWVFVADKVRAVKNLRPEHLVLRRKIALAQDIAKS